MFVGSSRLSRPSSSSLAAKIGDLMESFSSFISSMMVGCSCLGVIGLGDSFYGSLLTSEIIAAIAGYSVAYSFWLTVSCGELTLMGWYLISFALSMPALSRPLYLEEGRLLSFLLC